MQVKICGIRTPEGATACAASGADFAGINFVPGTRRAIDTAQANHLIPLLGGVTPIGVFQNAAFDTVMSVINATGIGWVQLHGEETPQMCAALKKHAKIIKALTADGAREEVASQTYAPHVDRFLVDGRTPGSGKRWAWEAVAALGGAIHGVPMMLAGGLTPENVAEAIASVRPAGVDTASGIETDGAQDPARILAFCQRARTGAPQGDP